MLIDGERTTIDLGRPDRGLSLCAPGKPWTRVITIVMEQRGWICYAFTDRINKTCKNLDDLAEGRRDPSWFSGLGEWMGDKAL